MGFDAAVISLPDGSIVVNFTNSDRLNYIYHDLHLYTNAGVCMLKIGYVDLFVSWPSMVRPIWELNINPLEGIMGTLASICGPPRSTAAWPLS